MGLFQEFPVKRCIYACVRFGVGQKPKVCYFLFLPAQLVFGWVKGGEELGYCFFPIEACNDLRIDSESCHI